MKVPTYTLLLVRSAMLGGALTACGASDAPPSAPARASSGVTEAPAATPPAPPPPAAAAVDRCEGLVGGCGGWVGCITVRADATTPGRYLGVGPNAGHAYAENHDCYAGVCNEICTGGSLSGCRPGLTEVTAPVVCSAAMPPMVAPFTCRMESGVCTQGPDPSMIPAS